MRKIIFTMVMAGCMVVGLNAQALKVDADGDVGIGQADPTTKFHLTDDASTLHIQQSAFGSGLGPLIDITPGLNGSTRVGAINTTSNLFGGAAFQAWSDNAGAFQGQFYFEAGNAANLHYFPD